VADFAGEERRVRCRQASTSTPWSRATRHPSTRCHAEEDLLSQFPLVVLHDDMCALCVWLLEQHWAEPGTGASQARIFRVKLANG